MSSKKSYSRYFIILQEDEKGHSISSDKQPSGYTKMEIKNDKCKVSFYVQNIKREKSGCYMFLIANKKDSKKIINLGILNIDDNGRADVNYECTSDNIGNSNMSIDKIGGAAIGKFIGGRPVFIMSGFSSTEIPQGWKEYMMIDCKKKDNNSGENLEKKEKTMVEEKEKEKENKKEEEKEKSKDKSPKCTCDDNKSTEKDPRMCEEKEVLKEEHIVEEEEKYKKDLEEAIIIEEKQVASKANDSEEKQEDQFDKIYRPPMQRMNHNEINEFDQYERDIEKTKGCTCKKEKKENDENNEEFPKGSVGEFFQTVMEGFEEVKGVCNEIKSCKWYRIPVKDLEIMCNISNYNKYTVVYYPMINYYPYIKKYGYYMMGLKYDSNGHMKYLVYGVPGNKDKSEQPYGGKSGFVTWVPVKSDEAHESHIGYWCMFYDFKNSIIVVPMK